MATGTIMLAPSSAVLPDGTTNNAAPGIQRVKSSATAPALHFLELAFDGAGSTREQCYWTFRLPTDYSSSPVLKVQWKANATTGNVVWQARIAAITPADVDTPNEKALPASTDTVTTGVNATEARRLVESSITLTNIDSMAAEDWVVINLHRDPSHASDTCTVDAEVVAISLEYTTA